MLVVGLQRICTTEYAVIHMLESIIITQTGQTSDRCWTLIYSYEYIVMVVGEAIISHTQSGKASVSQLSSRGKQ